MGPKAEVEGVSWLGRGTGFVAGRRGFRPPGFYFLREGGESPAENVSGCAGREAKGLRRPESVWKSRVESWRGRW